MTVIQCHFQSNTILRIVLQNKSFSRYSFRYSRRYATYSPPFNVWNARDLLSAMAPNFSGSNESVNSSVTLTIPLYSDDRKRPEPNSGPIYESSSSDMHVEDDSTDGMELIPKKLDSPRKQHRSISFHLFMKFIKKESLWLSVSSVFILLSAGSTVMTPFLFREFWAAYTGSLPLLLPGLKLASAIVLRFASQLVSSTLLMRFTERIATDVRLELFDRYLQMDFRALDGTRSDELLESLTSDVKEMRDGLRMLFGEGVPALARIVGGVFSLLLLSPQLTGVLGVTLLPGVLLAHAYSGRLRALSAQKASADAATVASAHEALGSLRTVRSFTGEATEMNKYSSALHASANMSARLSSEVNLFQVGVSAGMAALGALLAGVGAQLVHAGFIQSAELASFLFSTMELESAFETASNLSAKLSRTAGALQRLQVGLQLDAGVNAKGGFKWDHLNGHVLFDNVVFAYPGRPDVPVLRGVHLELKPDTVVAVVGASGSGKSTLANLLLRYYLPATHSATTSNAKLLGGEVKVDGVPLSVVDIHWLRKHMAYVSQDTSLFAATIRDNILYGLADSDDMDNDGARIKSRKRTFSDEEIIQAARDANAMEFIEKLPYGLDTFVGERGAALSGGQRQRIVIARALLRNPRILILDEATSALDSHSESLVQEAFERAKVGRTVMVIAHRLSTVARADKIYVMAQGKVVESGNHETLMNKGGVYSNLVRKQISSTHSGKGNIDIDSLTSYLPSPRD